MTKIRREDLDQFELPERASVLLQLVVGELDSYTGEEELLALPKGQRSLYLISLFDAEVRNGGLHQFFSNSAGDFTSVTLMSLRLVGARDAAQILQEAVKRFPNGTVPEDRNERADVLQEVGTEAFRDLDARYYALPKESGAWQCVVDFLKSHPHEFYS